VIMTELSMDPASALNVDARSMLIVDDDEIFRERLARALRERGFEVRTAEGFDQAVALATSDSPEYAVLDLRMPGKGGLEVLKALNGIDGGTRAIILTGQRHRRRHPLHHPHGLRRHRRRRGGRQARGGQLHPQARGRGRRGRCLREVRARRHR